MNRLEKRAAALGEWAEELAGQGCNDIASIALALHGHCTGSGNQMPAEEVKAIQNFLEVVIITWDDPTSLFDSAIYRVAECALHESRRWRTTDD